MNEPIPQDIMVPSEPLGPTRINPRVLTLYSLEKVGKTSACAAIPDSLLFCIDPNGADYVSARKLTREKELPDYKAFLAVCGQFKRARLAGKPYARRGILDTISDLEEWAFEKARDDYNLSPKGRAEPLMHILDLPGPKGSAGWGPFRSAFGELLWAFESAFEEVVWVAHQRETLQLKVTGSVSTDDIDAAGKMRDVLCRQSSAIGFLYRDEVRRNELWITFAGTDMIKCGSRCAHLSGKKFKLGELAPGATVPVFDWSSVFLPDEAPATLSAQSSIQAKP